MDYKVFIVSRNEIKIIILGGATNSEAPAIHVANALAYTHSDAEKKNLL